MKSLIVEGWRFIPHSYAIVNQFQLLEMRNRSDMRLYHRDCEFYQPHWRKMRGLFSKEQENELEAIPAPDNMKANVLRVTYPYNLTPVPGVKVFVFMTVEFGHVMKGDLSHPLSDLSPDVHIITCSDWSKEGVIRSGARADQISVVPHGVDHKIYQPVSEERRKLLRKKYQLEGKFVFFHAGAMTANKGIVLMLKAFAKIARREPRAQLMLKGLDSLYGSQKLLQQVGTLLTEEEKRLVGPKIKYVGGTFSFVEMAELYQVSDAYVSAYMGEGFNMPVLEAVASGLPVICTKGGPTDEFTTGQFALYVTAQKLPGMFDGVAGYYLQPNLECLVQQMEKVMEDSLFRQQARKAGPDFVSQGFLWSQVTERLLEIVTG